MGYACPVCGVPQADGEHLANHLAFTALLHGGDHADWLDERVPDWADRGPGTLASRVTEHAREVEDVPAEGSHDHGAADLETAPERGTGRGRMPREETERILAEARELTERMRGEAQEE